MHIKGIQLTLLIGPMVPVPAPRVVMDALEQVTVTTNDVGHSGFQLTFGLSTNSPLHTIFLLTGGSPIPLLRVIIMVTINGTADVLIDGMVTNHAVQSADTSGQASLTLTGEDISVFMDKQDGSGFPFPAAPAEGRVALLLAKYAFFGLIPKIIPSVMVDVPIPTERIPSQRGSDLAYIRLLASQVGYVFYIEPGPAPGTNIAFWGPQVRAGLPQPALTTNMDAHDNVDQISFEFDNDQNAIPTVFYYDERTRAVIPIPIPPISPISPPLGALPPIPTRLEPVGSDLAKLPLAKSIMIGIAKSAAWSEAVKGRGELSVQRYGRRLKARGLVGVRGAGMAFDGLHYVKSVTDRLERGSYKQSFELSRNGLISTIPQVPV